MAQSAQLGFNITIPVEVIKEYFEGQAKVEAAKAKRSESSVDLSSAVSLLAPLLVSYLAKNSSEEKKTKCPIFDKSIKVSVVSSEECAPLETEEELIDLGDVTDEEVEVEPEKKASYVCEVNPQSLQKLQNVQIPDFNNLFQMPKDGKGGEVPEGLGQIMNMFGTLFGGSGPKPATNEEKVEEPETEEVESVLENMSDTTNDVDVTIEDA